MRSSTLTACFVALCTIAAPVVVIAEPEPVVQKADAPARKAASAEELEQYAERERAADKQQRYEGGRRASVDLITIVLILLIIVLVLIIV